MVVNILLIIAILGAIYFAVKKGFLKVRDEDDTDYFEGTEKMNLDYLRNEVVNEFSKLINKKLSDDNLTRAELEKKRKEQSAISASIDEAPVGNPVAKKTVKNAISQVVRSSKYDLNEKTLGKYVFPFDNPAKLKPMDKFQLILFCYMKRYGEDALSVLIKENAWDTPYYVDVPLPNGQVRHEERYGISKARCNELYEKIKDDEIMQMDENDKFDFIVQKIYELEYGLGAIDMIKECTIDEIDAGVSGIPYGKTGITVSQKDFYYSFESIWITFHGLKFPIECLTFGSQEELERVSNLIYGYEAMTALSKTNSYVLSEGMDGARIVVFRPDFAEGYAFCLRKFDSSPGSTVDDWITDKGSIYPKKIMYWSIKGQRNCGITGQQGTGKTTLLKALIEFIDPLLAIRVQELKQELNLRYAYPFRNILSFQETAHITSQEGLNIQKKSNGDVNIIGEVANAIQASYVIQTSMVASLFAMFTHHANSATNFVNAIANNLLELQLYKEKRDAVEVTARILNIDCHLACFNQHRYIERITEIIPINNSDYPSDHKAEASLDEKYKMDSMEYYRKETDPKLFETRNIIEWHNGEYVLVNMPSDNWITGVRIAVAKNEKLAKEFEEDLVWLKSQVRSVA